MSRNGKERFRKQCQQQDRNRATPQGGRKAIENAMVREIVAAQAGWRTKDLERERKMYLATRETERWPDYLRRRRKELEAQGVTFLCPAR